MESKTVRICEGSSLEQDGDASMRLGESTRSSPPPLKTVSWHFSRQQTGRGRVCSSKHTKAHGARPIGGEEERRNRKG